jgi:ribonuclease P protein component
MYTFKKEERLCDKKLIEGLFHNGSSFLCYPFRVSWVLTDKPQSFAARVLISAPKKRFKRAVDRNLIKRRIREAYRLNKQQLLYDALVDAKKKIAFSIGYIGKEIADYELIEKKMQKLLTQLSGDVIK